MEFGTIAGIVLGFVLIFWAILSGGSLMAFVDLPSMAIVLGGTIGATLIHYPLPQVLGVVRVVLQAFLAKKAPLAETIQLLVRLANKARREGLLAMEEEAAAVEDPFLQKGAQLVVDGTDPETVRNILEIELTFLEERHRSARGILEAMAAYAPAFGMIGTLIGLINMLGGLDDPSKIGPGMAVALITTFYGSILANLVFLPIAGKLKAKSEEEILLRELIIEGVLSIQAGENPRIVEDKLKAFLSPKERLEALEADRSGLDAESVVTSGAR